MTFKIIDTKTGKEPTDRVITNIARKGGLMEMDIDGFYVGEDGQIILVDDCGNCTWVDAERFKIEPQTGYWIPVSERLPEDSGEYFVSIIDKYYDENYEDVEIAQFAHKKDYGIKESEWQIDEIVIAWMPLPKPYLPDTNIGNMSEIPTGSESEG